MSQRLPILAVTADGTTYTGPQVAAGAATVDIGMGAAIDRARLQLGWLSPLAGVEPGTEVSIDLGFGDDAETVLTGDVDSVAVTPDGLVIDVFARSARLRTLRVGRGYLDMAAGEIVEDLANEAEASTDEVDRGPTLAAFHVDESRHAWWHIQRLARLAATEVSTAADGGLRFISAPGGETSGLGGLAGAAAGAVASLLDGGGTRFGAELHDWSLATRGSIGVGSTAAAHGASSELGAPKWHVLLKEPSGGAPNGRVGIAAATRDRDAASAVSGAAAHAEGRSRQQGWLTITGDPSLRSGDAIDITEMPRGPNPSLRAACVRHRFGGGVGFVTEVLAEGAAP